MANDLLYRTDIYNAIYGVIMNYLGQDIEIPNGLIHDVLKTINEATSTFWNPCTDEDNVPPKGEEVLVSLEYPNGKKEIAFGEYWGENRNGDLAYWGGQNELVKAWARVPEFYEDD